MSAMNVLFALYGDFSSNSAIPLVQHASGLQRLGHACAVALPSGVEDARAQAPEALRVLSFADALADPPRVFADGRRADVLHAWTPREVVRRFVTSYQSRHPTPWIAYLEDNEGWIGRAALALAGFREDILLQHTEEVISAWTPPGVSHVLHYRGFVGLADHAVLIQDKLAAEVPPWVPRSIVMPGVDHDFFRPGPPDPALRARFGLEPDERVIVYPGGLNDFTRPGLEALCRAVGILNEQGMPVRLLRSGPVALDFLDRLPPAAAAAVKDLGALARAELPALYRLADLFVQPGKPSPFEDLRLPGKLPELLATGRPVVLPDTNIAQLLRDGVNAVLQKTGTPEEIAEKCLFLLRDPALANRIGAEGRRFAIAHFDPATQAGRLAKAYEAARDAFDPAIAAQTWESAQQLPMPALVARRLRLLAKAGGANAALLEEHACAIEWAAERAAGLEAGFAVRDREIAAEKGRAQAANDALARLDRELAAAHADIGALGARVSQSEDAVAQAQERLSEGARQRAALEVELAARDAHLDAMRASWSWRLTAPMRAFGGRLPVELSLRPLANDPVLATDASGHSFWRAESCDPAFRAAAPGGQRLPGGWYRARVRLVERSGRIAGPRIYISSEGGGYSEFRSVELALDDDAYAAELFISEGTTQVRFDPSIYPCEFEATSLQLTPLAGVRRWARTGAGLFRVAGHLGGKQLAVWFRQGLRVLFTRGPKALWDAAFWALANHARAQAAGYGEWVRKFDTRTPEELAAMRAASGQFSRQPVVSFITPVYNTPEPFLRAMIDSVIAQAYPRWELCIADDASTAAHVRRVLEEYRGRDPRIKVAWRETNGHISAASNTALEAATGDFVALLDHDDTLAPDALYWVVKEVNDHPDAALIYSDEDKLDFNGARANAYFKCDWNYDLFLSHNLITHLGVYRAGIVRDIGGFRTGFEGAQDYDLAARFIERIRPSQIRHIPRVLYHWRMLPGSTAVGAGEKDYAAERARLAVEEHLARTGVAGTVETVPVAVQRVRYALPEPHALASIIIPTRNGEKLVRQCIESVREKTTYQPYEILLVDNGSDDRGALAYFERLAAEGKARVLRDPLPFNFSRINNGAARQARGDFLVFLNNDIEVISPDWLTELVSHAQRPEVGAVGARLWYPDDTIQHAGLVLVAGLAGHAHLGKKRGDNGYFSRAALIQSLSAVTAACLCVRRDVFEEVGGFDETLAVAFNDVDLCLKIQAAGYRNVYTPYAELYHHESASRGYEDTPEKMQRFQKEADMLRERWMPVLMNDPYYNPNLTLSGEPFTLSWPPRVEGFRP